MRFRSAPHPTVMSDLFHVLHRRRRDDRPPWCRVAVLLTTITALLASFAAVGVVPANAATPTRLDALRTSVAHQLNMVSAHAASNTTPQKVTSPPKTTTPTSSGTPTIATSTPTLAPAPKQAATAPTASQQPTTPQQQTPVTNKTAAAADTTTAPSDTYTLSDAAKAFLAGLNINLGSGPVTGTLSGSTLTVQVGAPALPLTLPVGNDAISFGGASLTIDESTGRLTLSASATTVDGASGALSVTIANASTTTLSGSDLSATVTLNALPVLGTTVDLSGTLAYSNGAVSASLTGTLGQDTVIAPSVLTIGAGTTITLSTSDGAQVSGTAVIGSGSAQFTVKVSGAFGDEKNWDISIGEDTGAPSFSPVDGLTLTPAFSGSVQDKDGTISFDVTAGEPVSWNPGDNVTLAVNYVKVSNETPPTGVACPAGVKDGQLWVDVQGGLTDTAAGINARGEACVDPSAKTFTLTGTATGAFGPSDLGFTLSNPTVTVDGDLQAGTVSMSAKATLAVTAVASTSTIPVTLAFDSDGSFTAGATVDLNSIGLSSLGSGAGTLLVSSKEIKTFTAPSLGVDNAIDLPAGVTVLLQYTPSQTVSSAFSYLHLTAPQTIQASATLSTSGFKTTLNFAYGDGALGVSLLPSNPVGAQLYLNSLAMSLDVSEAGVTTSIGGSALLQLPSLYGSTPSSVELSLSGSIGETTDGATDVNVGFDLAAAYNGSWTDAFGIQGLSIGELAGKIGGTFAPQDVIPLPTLSFTVNNVVLPPDWANAIGEVGQPDVSATLDLDVNNPILSFAISPGAGQTVALEPLRIANDFTGGSPLPDSVVNQLQVNNAQLLFAPFGGTDATGASIGQGATLAFGTVIGGVNVHVDGDIALQPVPHLKANVTANGFKIGSVLFENTNLTIDVEADPSAPTVDFAFDGGFTDTGIQFDAHVDLGASISALGGSVHLHIAGGQPQYIQAGADLLGSIYREGTGFGFQASGIAGLVVGSQQLGQVYFTYSSDTGALWYQTQQAAGQVAQAFQNAYGWTDTQVTAALNKLHYGGAPIASALSSVFNDSIAQITSQLEQVGYSLDGAIIDVRAGLNATDAQITALLSQLGESVMQIASKLHTDFGDTGAQIASALQAVFSYNDVEVAGVLNQLQFSSDQIASALQSAFGDSDTAVASALNQVGLTSDQIASALQSAFGDSQAAVYNALQQIGDGGQSVLDSIAGFFNTGSYTIYSWWPEYLNSGGSQDPYHPIVQSTGSLAHSFDWYVLPTDGGYAEIINRDSGQCLSASYGGDGGQVVQNPCGGWTSQQWYLGVSPGHSLDPHTGHNVINRWNGLYLDVYNQSISDGAAIDTYHSTGNWNQWFIFDAAVG